MLSVQNLSRSSSLLLTAVVCRLIQLLFLFVALGFTTQASAQAGFSNLVVTPAGGMVGPGGTLYVSFSGTVQADPGDAVTAVLLHKQGVTGELATQNISFGEDRFGNPVNIPAAQNVAIGVALLPGRHVLYLQAATVNSGIVSSEFTVVVDPPPYNGASFVSHTIPANMVAGQVYPVSVTMRNSGTKTWVGGGGNPYRLAAPAPMNSIWSYAGAEVSGSVAPGGQVTFSFNVTAPYGGGAVNLHFRMVQEGVELFGDYSSMATVEVSIPQPAAAFTLPAEGASYTEIGGTASPTFSGNVNPGNGASISSVQLLEGGVPFASGAAGSISGSKALSVGNHTIELRVTDSRGQVASAYRTVRVVAQSTASYTTPVNGATYPASGATTSVPVSVTAVAAAGSSVSQIRLYVDHELKTIRPGSSLTSSQPLTVGPHILGVDAVDSNGVAGPVSSINVTVAKPTAPVAAFSTPVDGSSVTTGGTSANVPISGSATPAAGASISRLKLYVDGGLVEDVVAATVSTARTLSVGNHILELEATDSFGSVGVRRVSRVTVVGPPPPATASFSSPLNNASYTVSGSTANVSVMATGVPSAGATIKEMRFYINGTLTQTRPGATYSETHALAKNSYTLGIEAVDSFDSVSPRSNISITVKLPAAPTATFTYPAAGSTYAADAGSATVPIRGTGAVATGATMKLLRLYVDGVLTHTSATSPLTYTATLSAGAHTLALESVDSYDTVSTRKSVVVTVSEASSAVPIPVAITPPHLENPDAGTLPGSLAVGSSGAASYSVGIVVPPGTAGMQPNLSLNYSSNGSNGMAGLGWSLGGFSTIHRCAKTIAQDGVPGRIAFDGGDRLCLDGMRLLRADGSGTNPDTVYWQNPTNAQYRTEIENFARITRLANGGFEVKHKNGSVQKFGTTPNTAIAAQGRTDLQPLLWALAETADRSGNYMTYEYSVDSTTGEYLPKQIRYGANSVAPTTADLAVRFSYEGRPDAQFQYMGGSRNDLRSRLTNVKTYINTAADGSGGTLARNYVVRYVESKSSGRSLVDSLQVCDEFGKCMPKTQMGWGYTPLKLVQKFTFIQNLNGDNESIPVKSVSGNFDGSGRTINFFPTQGPPACTNCPSLAPRAYTGQFNGTRAGEGSIADVSSTVTMPAGTGKYSEAVAGDLDGNGRDDLVLFDIGARRWAYCLSLETTDSNPSFAPCLVGGTLPAARPYAMRTEDLPNLVSLRNNGKSQLMFFDHAGSLFICGLELSAVSCKTAAVSIPVSSPSFDLFPINLSKQGTSDFYTRWKTAGAAGSLICNFYEEKLTCKESPGSMQDPKLGPADMNGDGLTDLMSCLSKETGVDCRNFGPTAIGSTLSFIGAADFVGDGVARFWQTEGSQSSLCQILNDKFVCRPVDTSAIPASTIALNADTFTPYRIDATGIPASLNCSDLRWYTNQYVKDCWVSSVAAPADQDRLINVVNGVGHREEVTYARADDSTVYTRYATVNNVVQRPVYPQLGTSPSTMTKTLRRGNGQGGWITNHYRYAGAMADANGRGSLGFTFTSMTDANGILTDTAFSQVFPFTGAELLTIKRNYYCQLSSVNATPQSIPFNLATGAKSIFVTTSHFDTNHSLDCVTPKSINTVNEYTDGWGNLNKQTITTTAGGKTFTSQAVNVFDTASGVNTRSGLPKSQTTMRTDPVTGTLTRSVVFDYDAKGLIKSQTVEPSDVKLMLKTTYDRTRNVFGLVNSEKQTWTNPACADPAWMAIKSNSCVAAMAVTVSDTSYDTKGRFKNSIKNAKGHTQTNLYDPKSGTQKSRIDANLLETTWDVDTFGRITKERTPDGKEKRTLVKACEGACPNGATVAQITEFFHGTSRIASPQVSYTDSSGHQVQSKTWGFDGRVIVLNQRYDALGRLSEEDWPRFEGAPAYLSKKMSYDDFNRVTGVTTVGDDGVERTTSTAFQGLVTQRTNLLLQQRTDRHDALGQLIEVQDSNQPVRGVTQFDYDPFGNLSKTTDPNGNVISVVYDLLGRRTKLIDPDLGIIEYGVDPLGRTWWQASPRMRIAAQKSYVDFDILGRITGRYEPDLKSFWVYDTADKGKGQLAETYTMIGTVKDYVRTHTYDLVGRPAGTSQKLSDGTYRSRLDYDDWGRPISSTYQRGADTKKVFSKRYNANGYLARIERGNLVLWQVTEQDAENRPRRLTLGNGLIASKEFRPYTGRLFDVRATAGGVPRLSEGYDYDLIGSVTQRTQYWDEGGFSETFTYDRLNRLETSKIGQVQQVFAYDLAGNIKSKTGAGTYVYPPQGSSAVRPHAVTTVSELPGTFAYDENGNFLSVGDNSATWTSFDMPLRLVKGGANAEFVYGPEHQRTRQKRGDGATVVYAEQQEVETKSGITTVKTYWPDGIGVEIDRGSAATEMTWTHLDRLGSPVALTSESGTIREKLEYDAWGMRRSTSDNHSTPSSLDGKVDNRGFTGHEMLDQLDLVHMNGRIYDPRIGRFRSADPFINDPVNGQSYNRYAYVLNNPTNFTDPTGYREEPILAKGQWVTEYKSDELQKAELDKAAAAYGRVAQNLTTVAGKGTTVGGGPNSGQLVPNPLVAGCKVGPCKPSDWKPSVDWLGAGKATVGVIGNAGGVVAGAVMMGAPTGVTQVVGSYLVADGSYGVVSSGLDFAAAVGWRNNKVDDSVSSLPRLIATIVAPGSAGAQRAADATSLAAGLFGGRMIVQPLMFSSRQIYATSNMSPAAQAGLTAFSAVQVYDASVPAVQTIQKAHDQK